ncbi:MAG: hypothetical protein IT385_13705 [Deltaproteobacteria bacterium]|nr:hypothetical protein [Deltaproteobacteria bacterium]
MLTTSISPSLRRSLITGTCVAVLGSAVAHATPADEPAPADSAVTRRGEPAPTLPLGIDLLPYAGSSSASPDARRVVSLNLVGGLAGGLDALELGGALNIQTGRVRGAQLSGALNVVDADVHGAQLAGGLNLATGELVGAQLGPIDVALGDVRGAQIGAINVAGGRVTGAQIGAINVASGGVDGVQIGAINVASKAKAGIGLVNVYWDGWTEADLAVTETTLTLAGVRHGSDGLYNVYYAGTRLDRPTDLTLGIGIGGRWQIAERLELSLDVTTLTTALEGRFTGMHAQTTLRPQIAWRVTDALALWAGPTLNVLATDQADVDLGLPSSAVRVGDAGDDVQVWMWPGFAAGLRLF